MKNFLIIFTLTLLICAPLTAGSDDDCVVISPFGSHIINDDIEIDLHGGSVIISEKRRGGDEIEITENGRLFINGDLTKTSAEQRELLVEYNDLVYQIYDQATDIGLEGAKIGLEGAGLGLKAIACVFKLIRSDYDEDDMEREMERAADKLEAKADKLEKKADKIEGMAEDLEDLHLVLGENIPELAELDWWDE